MKFEDAKKYIKDYSGYRVEFEQQNGGILASDHFPDDDEDTIATEEEAWEFAECFAKAGKRKGIVNVYVIHGDDYTPVPSYRARKLNAY